MLRNRCPLSIGIGVRNGLEWVSENYWNRCPDSSEYAGIQREKPEGVYVYFSDNPVTYKQQRESRSKLAHPAGEFLSEADAVVVLSALIKHHGICLEEIMALSEIRMHKISSAAIRDFLEHHGLVKKTPATKS